MEYLKTSKTSKLKFLLPENDGCDGGYMTNAYIYAAKNPGVDKESTYPYEARQSSCRFNRANVGGECMTHMEIQIGNEKALEQAVATGEIKLNNLNIF